MKEEPLNSDELLLFNRRDFLIRLALTVPSGVIFWRLWDLQIQNGEKYRELSKGNRIRLKSTPAPRGIIYDTNNIILSKNIPSYHLNLVREDTKDIEKILKKLSLAIKVPYEEMMKIVRSKRWSAKFASIRIYKDLTWRQVSLVNAYQEEFPGISIEVSPRRFYPLLHTGSHVFGYTNRISKAQLKKLPISKLMSAQVVGQDGIESTYNHKLIGIDGGRQVQVDSTGREIKKLGSIEPIAGIDVKLSIDSRLQKKIETIFRGRKGAAIVMDPRNCAVLSMTSAPFFDPNLFAQGISVKDWNRLRLDPDHALNNKCIHGIFSPGSTFKMVVAIAGLEMGLIDYDSEHLCEGVFKYNRLRVHCWKRSGHGLLNTVGALEKSCNIFFYKIALEIGVDKIKEYANRLGLGEITGIDLPNEKSGLMPDKAWKRKQNRGKWYIGETLPVAIGQGYVSTTPLQLINYINVIANRGNLIKPRIVKEMITNPASKKDEFGNIEQMDASPSSEINPVITKKVDLNPDILEIIREGMLKNVQSDHGTGKNARSKKVLVSGKTGTTQVISYTTRAKIIKERGVLDEKYFDHAWFVGFAPSENPTMSLVVMLENGKAGKHAAKMAKKIFDYYFTEIEPPPTPQPEDPLKDLLNLQS